MLKFTKIPQDTFASMQLDAGVLLSSFDPAAATEPADEDILCATTGGVQIRCVPKYVDMGANVDNCPEGTKELLKLAGWECSMGFTSLGMTAADLRLALGAADVENGSVKPRRDLADGDFKDVWWVGDTAGGGLVAVCLKNALSDGGLEMQTAKNGKGQLTVSLKGYASAAEPGEVPMEFYAA